MKFIYKEVNVEENISSVVGIDSFSFFKISNSTYEDFYRQEIEFIEGQYNKTLIIYSSSLVKSKADFMQFIKETKTINFSVCYVDESYNFIAELIIPNTKKEVRRTDYFYFVNDLSLFNDYVISVSSCREFNTVSVVEDKIEKFSLDKNKIVNEYTYYHLLPEEIKSYFLEPVSLRKKDKGYSYLTEKSIVPDLSLLWTNFQLNENKLSLVFNQVKRFIDIRPSSTLIKTDELFLGKVKTREQELIKHSSFESVRKKMLGVEPKDIFSLYYSFYEKVPKRHSVISHGDMCLSNMFFNFNTNELKFIDPRGATSKDDLYIDYRYDIAKISHSILGDYDFINKRYKIPKEKESYLKNLKGKFLDFLKELNVDYSEIRILEASLFLSMTPLHIEDTDKVCAFLKKGHSILKELNENNYHYGRKE